jgi:hypothetical protein
MLRQSLDNWFLICTFWHIHTIWLYTYLQYSYPEYPKTQQFQIPRYRCFRSRPEGLDFSVNPVCFLWIYKKNKNITFDLIICIK